MIARPLGVCLLASAALLAGCASSDDKREGVDLFPLYRNLSDATSGERSVLWPLSNAEWDEGKDSKSSWIFPFYVSWHSGAQEDGTFVPIIPLYMHHRTAQMETTQYIPFYGHATEDGVESNNVLLFLFEWSRVQSTGELEKSSVFPLYQWERGGSGQRFSLLRAVEMFPPNPVVSLLDVDTRVPAFYGAGDEPGLDVDVAHVIGKLVQVFHWGDAGSYTETRFVTIFASESLSLFRRRVPHEGAPGATVRSTTLFPLFHTEEAKDASEWSVIAGAFGMRHTGDKRTLRLLWIPIDLDDDADADADATAATEPDVARERT